MRYFEPMNRRLLLLSLLLAVPALGCPTPDISPLRARELVAGGARLVDVRSPEEFADGHVAGAVNIPVDEIAQRLTKLEPRDRAIVVYCRSGFRSSRARKLLEAAGFRLVYDLGSMSNWEGDE